MKTQSYYKGRESVWRELYKGMESNYNECAKDLMELQKRVFHEKEDREMIANQSKMIDDLEKREKNLANEVNARQAIIKENNKFLLGLYEEIMTINNLSAEERLRFLRDKYKTDYENLKAGRK